MRIIDLYSSSTIKPIISFEFYRPKTEKAAANLNKAFDSLAAANPDYVSVTFGAGGSNREGGFEIVDHLKNQRKLNTVAYIASTGLGPDAVVEVLDRFKSIGIETVFVIRGDAPTWDENYQPHPEAMEYASDLLSFIKKQYDFCLGAAGYPETHSEATNPVKDLEMLKLKVDQGAEYIVAQYFYDNQFFYDYVDKARAKGIKVPIIPGIMPIYTIKMTENLAGLCGTKIVKKVRDGLDQLPKDDKNAVLQFGVDFATEQCRDLIKNGVKGLHFYTMNRSKSVVSILNNLKSEGLL